MTAYTIQGIEQQIEDIDKRLEELKTLVARRNDLLALRNLIGKLENRTPNPKSETTDGRVLETHSDYVKEALRIHGPLAMPDLIDAVRKLGWKGSGDNATDKARLNNPLYREREAFQLINGRWSLK
jgi:hypothetical protein